MLLYLFHIGTQCYLTKYEVVLEEISWKIGCIAQDSQNIGPSAFFKHQKAQVFNVHCVLSVCPEPNAKENLATTVICYQIPQAISY